MKELGPIKYVILNTLPSFSFYVLRQKVKTWEYLASTKTNNKKKLKWYVLFTWMQQYNTEVLVNMVREQFKKHMHETDPEKIQKLKDEWVSICSIW